PPSAAGCSRRGPAAGGLPPRRPPGPPAGSGCASVTSAWMGLLGRGLLAASPRATGRETLSLAAITRCVLGHRPGRRPTGRAAGHAGACHHGGRDPVLQSGRRDPGPGAGRCRQPGLGAGPAGGPDVLVDVEDVARVVAALDPGQPVIVAAVGGPDPVL